MDFLKIGKIFAQDYYAIPDYQRDYEWTAAQNATLIDDVLQIARDNSSSNHFFGAIVTIPYEEGTGVTKSIDFSDYEIDTKNVKHIVDGQQRLTSFSVLIQVIRNLVLEDETVSKSFKDNFARRQLDNILLGNNYRGNNPAPRLILNGNTGACYNKEILEISDQPYSKIYKGAKRLLAAYKLFKNELNNGYESFKDEGLCKNTEEFYAKIISSVTNRVIFVEIECDASSDAFQVFDSLNGKGLDLTAADRIKNIFMSWIPQKNKGAQKWDALVSDIGEDYLANFFVSLFFYSTKKRIPKNKLPEQFKNTYKESAGKDFDYFLKELQKAGVLYGKLRKANTSNKKINNVIYDFQSLNMDQVYVLLFAVAMHYGEDVLNTDEYLEFSQTLQKLIVRMQVCEKSTNKLDILFANCIDAMKEKSAPLSLIIQKLNDEIQTSVDDEQFKVLFAKFCPNDNKVAEFYLRHIENYLRKESGNRSRVERGLTVEHIIPQTLYELSDWYGDAPIPENIVDDFNQSVVECIGNKALLYGDDNSSAGNNNYDYKLDVYNNGKRGQDEGTPVNTFKLISDVVEHNPSSFFHNDVEERAKRLAECALKIW